ncbi:MAG: hypothetical protein ABI721_00075 [Candidatus Dojkabacteria bacterium]
MFKALQLYNQRFDEKLSEPLQQIYSDLKNLLIKYALEDLSTDAIKHLNIDEDENVLIQLIDVFMLEFASIDGLIEDFEILRNKVKDLHLNNLSIEDLKNFLTQTGETKVNNEQINIRHEVQELVGITNVEILGEYKLFKKLILVLDRLGIKDLNEFSYISLKDLYAYFKALGEDSIFLLIEFLESNKIKLINEGIGFRVFKTYVELVSLEESIATRNKIRAVYRALIESNVFLARQYDFLEVKDFFRFNFDSLDEVFESKYEFEISLEIEEILIKFGILPNLSPQRRKGGFSLEKIQPELTKLFTHLNRSGQLDDFINYATNNPYRELIDIITELVRKQGWRIQDIVGIENIDLLVSFDFIKFLTKKNIVSKQRENYLYEVNEEISDLAEYKGMTDLQQLYKMNAISGRLFHSLRRAGIDNLQDFQFMTADDCMLIREFAELSLKKVMELMKLNNISFSKRSSHERIFSNVVASPRYNNIKYIFQILKKQNIYYVSQFILSYPDVEIFINENEEVLSETYGTLNDLDYKLNIIKDLFYLGIVLPVEA